uniref:Cycloidea-like protein n=1 Tax=Doronicum orientale TaxID=118769 RepID=A0A346D3K0_9ASTR|nr:cycloidea-like protein [Doronicum orientale]
MFSSNPFQQLPSSINVFSPPNSFLAHEKDDDVHFNDHRRNHNSFISGDLHFHTYNSPPPFPATGGITTIEKDFVMQQQFSEDHDELLDSVISPYKTKMATSKKDGHSKIYTARGPRDRRVRLSIGIAQKFFCLQDLLGFDKASKTLDWLLTKSLTAIKDLVEETNHCSSSTITDQSKVDFLETIRGSDEDNGKKKKSVQKCGDGKKKKMIQKCKSGSQESFARDQLRVEARARARERTKEKLRVKKINDELKTFVHDPCDQSGGCWGQIESQNDYKDIRWDHAVDDSDLE